MRDTRELCNLCKNVRLNKEFGITCSEGHRSVIESEVNGQLGQPLVEVVFCEYFVLDKKWQN